jgi:hypothetical protein
MNKNNNKVFILKIISKKVQYFKLLVSVGIVIHSHTWPTHRVAEYCIIHGPLMGLYSNTWASNGPILQHPPAVWTTGAAEFKTGQERKQVSAQQHNTQDPPQPQLATEDVEAGAKLGEGRGREAFGEDVHKL